MIKKIIILLTISNFIYSQERVDEILTKIDKTILTSISKADGYIKTDYGKWISKPNRIPFKLEAKFENLSNSKVYSLGENKENFVKYEFRNISIKDSTYYILIKYYKDGFYEYKSIQEGWNFTKSIDFYVINKNDFMNFPKIKNDTIINFKIKPILDGTIEFVSDYNIGLIEKKINEMELKSSNLSYYEKKYKKDNYLYFNIFTFKEKTRFLINSFQEDLKEYYYEINRTEFEEFFKFIYHNNVN